MYSHCGAQEDKLRKLLPSRLIGMGVSFLKQVIPLKCK